MGLILLLEFKFSNFRSFYEEQTLSFVASPLKGREACVSNVKSPLADKVLPISILYGANASGKSNTTKALKFMVEQVIGSFSRADTEQKIDRMPFALRRVGFDTPGRFELAFMIESVSYEYGFELNDTIFIKEWLHAYPKGSIQKWYRRNQNDYKFSENLRGHKESLKKITPQNSLFLSVAARSENEQLQKVFNFFKEIHFDLNPSVDEKKLSKNIRSNKIDPRTIGFLNAIETGISGYKLVNKKISKDVLELADRFFGDPEKFTGWIELLAPKNSDKLSDILPNIDLEKAKNEVLSELEKETEVYFTHHGADIDLLGIAFKDESEGSKRLVRLVQDAFRALDAGNLFVVDELDASLHTRACSLFVKLFLDSDINKNGAQLFATTHDTNLLSNHIIRRDEAWFVEKDNLGQSKLYSASEFKVRKDQNLEDVYLDDRFGALPPKVDPKWLLVN